MFVSLPRRRHTEGRAITVWAVFPGGVLEGHEGGRGRGAAHELRLLFEGVTGIGEAARAGRGELIPGAGHLTGLLCRGAAKHFFSHCFTL